MKVDKIGVALALVLMSVGFVAEKDPVLAEIEYSDKSVELIRLSNFEKYSRDLGLDSDTMKQESKLNELILFRLKMKEAVEEGLAKDSSILSDVKEYKERIALPYLMDKELIDPLVKEYYERSAFELRASHLLILLEENKMGKDTVDTYKKIMNIKQEIEKGLTFEAAVEKYSEDPSAKSNKGDLGYFSVGMMVYPFENGAYSAVVGKIHGPFRTQFGYHLLKVVDKRKMDWARYSQIFISLGLKPLNEDSSEAYYKINELKLRLGKGEGFEELAKAYSEDERSREVGKGGELGFVSKGELPYLELNQAADKLKNVGDVSDVVRTRAGLHILKLQRKGMGSYEETRDELRERVLSDQSRVLVKRKTLIEKLKKEIRLEFNQKIFDKFRKNFDEAKVIQDVIVPILEQKEWLLKVGSKLFVLGDFISFSKQTAGLDATLQKEEIDLLLDEFRSMSLIHYATERLASEENEFTQVMQKYQTGSMIFTLTQKKVWDLSTPTESELKAYYVENKEKFRFKDRVHVSALQIQRRKEAIEIFNELKKKKRVHSVITKSDVAFLRKPIMDSLKVLSKKDPLVKEKRERLQNEMKKIVVDDKPRSFEKLKKVYPVIYSVWQAEQDSRFELVKRKSVEKPRQMTYEEAKTAIYSEMQDVKSKQLMDNWVNSLRHAAKIKINKENLVK
ncbi:hypothetical protein CHS0354_000681 [Potamilus streckersoni]|uniref:PpiC domain-containing protein n=1 Tax=Potamilus streckersoni TaxID=2493646 RepID=A0AAE0T780_9BIVA|nr:hypothetical protein CHS0354_000681 [Potamilus streckersoni]